MSERAFYEPKAKDRAKEAIQAVESQTSAEVVITLRHISGAYRHADYLFGFMLALVTLIAMLFVSYPFALISFPLDTAVMFIVGAIASSRWPAVRSLLSSKAERHENVRRAARAAFVDQGITRCSGRWGILVYVTMFERKVEVVPDIGIDVEKLGAPWREALSKMQTAVGSDLDFDKFLEGFRDLGPALGATLPHQIDDVNELPDDIETGISA